MNEEQGGMFKVCLKKKENTTGVLTWGMQKSSGVATTKRHVFVGFENTVIHCKEVQADDQIIKDNT